jgi:hypothetical protein
VINFSLSIKQMPKKLKLKWLNILLSHVSEVAGSWPATEGANRICVGGKKTTLTKQQQNPASGSVLSVNKDVVEPESDWNYLGPFPETVPWVLPLSLR